MNVTYDLSEQHCKEAVFSCTTPLRLTSDAMTIYVGNNKEHATVILVQTDAENVLLHEDSHDFRSISAEGPTHPWVFEVKSALPLMFDATYSIYASIGGHEIYCGDDHSNVPFIAVTLLTGETYVFRLPDGADTEAWTGHYASPMRQTVGDPVPRTRTSEPDLDDPAVRRETEAQLKEIMSSFE